MSRYYQTILNVLTPAFPNTYSMAFDGVDDYVGLGTITDLNGGVSAFSTSLWFNYSGTPSTSNNMLLSGGTGVTDRLYIQLIATDTIRYTMGGGFDDVNVGTLTSGTWYNLITVHDGADVDIYLNGTLKGSFTDQVPTSNFATTMKIGNYISGAYWWNGNIDEVSLFNSALSLTDRNTIYGTGTPSDLSSLNPTAWYRMGENGSYKSPQWLLPENSNKDKLSNYSFEFDGVGDNISLSSNIDLGTLNTVSFWIKRNDTAIAQPFGNTTAWSDFLVRLQTTQISFGSTSFVFNDATTLSLVNQTTNWTHLMFVRNGANCNLFVNGVDRDGAKTNSNAAAVNKFRTIGSPGDGSTWNFNGSIDEIALWTSDESSNISAIYNDGEPTTLPSGAVAHYKMGEDATFSTNWTVPDAVGSADGTSANMTIEDRVGDAPNSSNNSLSYNMDEVDREEDVPR
jgi:hypothetical protein